MGSLEHSTTLLTPRPKQEASCTLGCLLANKLDFLLIHKQPPQELGHPGALPPGRLPTPSAPTGPSLEGAARAQTSEEPRRSTSGWSHFSTCASEASAFVWSHVSISQSRAVQPGHGCGLLHLAPNNIAWLFPEISIFLIKGLP